MKGQSDTDIEILRMMITEGRGGKLEQSREKRGGLLTADGRDSELEWTSKPRGVPVV